MSAKINNIFNSCNDSCEKSTFQSDEMDFSELLPITEKNGKLLINARDLHHFFQWEKISVTGLKIVLKDVI